MIFRDDSFFIYDTETGFTADKLTDEDLKNLDDSLGGFTILVDCYPNTNMLIPVSEVYPSGSSTNIKGFYKNIEQLSKQPEIICKKLPNVSLEIVKKMIDIACNIKTRTNSEGLGEDIGEWLVNDPAVRLVYQRQYNPRKIIYKGGNKDVIQNKATDRLFYALPADSLITAIIDDNNAPLPKMKDLCNAYPSPLYGTKYIKKILEAPQEARLSQIQYAVKELKSMDYDVPDANTLMRGFKLIPKDYVFGNPENNNLPIQENEQDYYNSLIEFIKHHIHLFNEEVMKGSSKEEIEAKDEKDFNTGNIPKRLELYLSDLLNTIVGYHYGHTGRFVISKGLFLDDETAVESNNDNFEIAYMTENQGSDADICIKGYIQLSAQIFGAGMWAEGIVKIARWGERKPTILEIGENNPNVIELTTFNVHTATLNIDNLEKLTDSNGRSLYISGYILYEFLVDGMSNEIPATLIISEKYKNPADETKIEQVFSLISIQDFIRLFHHGVKNDFVGVDYANGRFRILDDFEFPLCADSVSALETKTITTEYFVKLCMQHGITNAKPLAYALVNHTSVRDFTPDSEDYLTYLSNYPDVLKANAFLGIMLDAFEKSIISLEFNGLSDYLNNYQNTIYPKYEELMKCFNPNATSAQSLATSNLFNEMKPVDKEDNLDFDSINQVDKQAISDLYKGDLSRLSFTKLVMKREKNGEKELKVIGGCAIDNSANQVIMVFASVNDDVQYNDSSKPALYSRISHLLLGAAIARNPKSSIENIHKFVSEATLETMYRSLLS